MTSKVRVIKASEAEKALEEVNKQPVKERSAKEIRAALYGIKEEQENVKV